MNLTNIIIIVIILIIIYIVLTKLILKTNILYDDILDASEEPEYSVLSGSGFFSNNRTVSKNEIPNDVMSDNFTSNFMISVWFYVDNWSGTRQLKNILYFANNKASIAISPSSFTGISDISCNDTTTDVIQRFSLILDQYDNNLFIDIASMQNDTNCNKYDNRKDIHTRYKIENIPIQKWNCLTISVDTLLLDVYLDGKLTNSFILPSTFDPGNQVNNIYLGNGDTDSKINGFQGFITRVRYEPNAINTQEALNIYRAGINKSLLKSIFNRYSMKVSFLEYNKEKGSFSI